MGKKKLLCIVGGMNAGGAETFLMKIFRRLDREEYQMDFAVAIAEEGCYDEEIQSLGGKIYHIVPKTQGLLKNLISIRNVVKENHYKYVLRISQHSLSALELLPARLGGAETCIFRSSNSSTTGNKASEVIHKLCMFMPCLFADVRIAPSTEAAEFMFGKGSVSSGKAKLIHNAVDLDVFRYDACGRTALRQEFGLSEDSLLVGHVGRFSTQKNHGFLMEVFQEIVMQQPNAKLLLVGKGELEQAVRKQAEDMGIADKVIFAGVRSDIPQILSAMDVFVFPSLYEGMPNTVIEAQATGLPCVIADTITREADITGLVQHLPLDLDAKEWAETALCAARKARTNTRQIFIDQGYDIQSAVREFTKLCFDE